VLTLDDFGSDVIQPLTVIMPLYEADSSIDRYTLQKVPEQFIIFYSSITNDGQMWCPVDTFLSSLEFLWAESLLGM
jgi:hypothetical protein